jgi:tyrosyl-tRNA synthetase
MRGRDLQQDAGQEPQVCLTLPILRGLDGVRRMGKSLGNYIGVGESAYDQFAKTMSTPDTVLREWFELLTERPAEEVARLTDPQRTHPMEAKKTLGRDIVTFYHGRQAADEAAAEWARQRQQGHDPADMPEVVVPAAELTDGKIGVCRLLVLMGFAKSNNEARRLVEGGAVNYGPDRVKVTDPKASLAVHDGLVVRSGKLNVGRVRLREGRP